MYVWKCVWRSFRERKKRHEICTNFIHPKYSLDLNCLSHSRSFSIVGFSFSRLSTFSPSSYGVPHSEEKICMQSETYQNLNVNGTTNNDFCGKGAQSTFGVIIIRSFQALHFVLLSSASFHPLKRGVLFCWCHPFFVDASVRLI